MDTKNHHLTNHLNIRIKNISAAVVQKALKELYYKTKHVNNFLNKETLVQTVVKTSVSLFYF